MSGTSTDEYYTAEDDQLNLCPCIRIFPPNLNSNSESDEPVTERGIGWHHRQRFYNIPRPLSRRTKEKRAPGMNCPCSSPKKKKGSELKEGSVMDDDSQRTSPLRQDIPHEEDVAMQHDRDVAMQHDRTSMRVRSRRTTESDGPSATFVIDEEEMSPQGAVENEESDSAEESSRKTIYPIPGMNPHRPYQTCPSLARPLSTSPGGKMPSVNTWSDGMDKIYSRFTRPICLEQPISHDHRRRLLDSQCHLVEDIVDVAFILDHLTQDAVIYNEMKEVIQRQITSHEQVRVLLRFLQGHSEKAFFSFAHALRTAYPHLFCLLVTREEEVDIINRNWPVLDDFSNPGDLPLNSPDPLEVYRKRLREFLLRQTQEAVEQDSLECFEKYTPLRLQLNQVVRRECRRGYKLLKDESDESANPYTVSPSQLFEVNDEWKDHPDPHIVLIRGRAGIGKSTFVRKLVQEWAEGKIWKEKFDTVYLFHLRDFNSRQDTLKKLTCRELIMTRHGPEVRERTEEKIWQTILRNPKRTLFILDGLDEYRGFDKGFEVTKYYKPSNGAHIPNLLWNLLKQNIFNGSYVILTSRPRAIGLKFLPSFHRTVEIYGFDKRRVLKYFKKFFRDNQSKLLRVTQFFQANDNLFSVCYIPVVCRFMSESVGEMVENANDTRNWLQNPKTLTQIFTLAMQYFALNHHPRYKLGGEKPKDPLEVVVPFVDSFLQLAELAHWGMTCQPMKLVFTSQDLKEARLSVTKDMSDFGLLSSVKHELHECRLFKGVEPEEHSFLHLLVMEYLTAVHLCVQEWEHIQAIIQLAATGQFDMVYLFMQGLMADRKCHAFLCKIYPSLSARDLDEMQKKACKLLRALSSASMPSSKAGKVLLIIMLHESQQTVMADEVFQSLSSAPDPDSPCFEMPNGLDISEAQLTTSDCRALAFMLDHIHRTPGFINLNNNMVGNDGVRVLCKGKKSITNCYVVKLGSNDIDVTGAEYLAQALDCESQVRELDLGGNLLGERGLHCLCQMLQHSGLTSLGVGDNVLEGDALIHLENALPTCQLSKLDLSDNHLGPEGMEHLSRGLPKSQLKELSLGSAAIGDGGLQFLSKVLPHTKITKINLGNNDIGPVGMEALAEALLVSPLEELELWSNLLGDDDARILSQALPRTNLIVLNLAANQLEDEGASHLSRALPESKLKTLALYDNKIGDPGAINLSNALPDSKLRTLSLCGNRVTIDSAEWLAKAAEKSQALMYLSLSDETFDDAIKDQLYRDSGEKLSFYPT